MTGINVNNWTWPQSSHVIIESWFELQCLDDVVNPRWYPGSSGKNFPNCENISRACCSSTRCTISSDNLLKVKTEDRARAKHSQRQKHTNSQTPHDCIKHIKNIPNPLFYDWGQVPKDWGQGGLWAQSSSKLATLHFEGPLLSWI